MWYRALAVASVLAAGCGRHGFDPVGTNSDANGTGASRDGDSSGDSSGLVDATFDTSPSCINDLSNIGTANFEITFTVQATATVKSALVHQRSSCTAATYWDVHLNDANRVVLELSAGGSMSSTPSLVTVANGAPHQIRCTRIGTSVGISVDGGAANTQLGSTFNFGALPAIAIAGSHPCAGFSTLSTGTVTNVCVRLL